MSDSYAGIGSRSTPEDILDLMVKCANHLRGKEFILRSGHAPGADQAFERGAGGMAEIYLPWPTFCNDVDVLGFKVDKPADAAFDIASVFHTSWSYLKWPVKAIHARNVHQVLGKELDDPVRFVLCWTPDGSLDGQDKVSGGTGQALRVAKSYDIPVYNFQRLLDRQVWEEKLELRTSTQAL